MKSHNVVPSSSLILPMFFLIKNLTTLTTLINISYPYSNSIKFLNEFNSESFAV